MTQRASIEGLPGLSKNATDHKLSVLINLNELL